MWSAIAAGLSMGFSMPAPALMHGRIGEAPATPLLAFGYSFGFLLVILGKQQLFTGNTLTAVLPVMTRPSLSNTGRLLRLWGLVFPGNTIGVALFAWALARLDITDIDTQAAMVRMGTKLMDLDAGQIFAHGIFAGWLIALAGNLVGGSLIFALISHAQVRSDAR